MPLAKIPEAAMDAYASSDPSAMRQVAARLLNLAALIEAESACICDEVDLLEGETVTHCSECDS